jgi:hypothetical protein
MRGKPLMEKRRSTLVVYNTADRLLRGDFFHTVSVRHIGRDLASYPSGWLTLGVGTTNWMGRNGEVIIDGTVSQTRYLWADPDSNPAGEILDIASHRPRQTGKTPLVTPEVGVDDAEPHFPFVAVAVCDPGYGESLTGENIKDVHEWLIEKLTADNWGLMGVRMTGEFGHVHTTDAYNIPMGGLDLSEGYAGEDHFRMEKYDEGQWVMSGLYAANVSLRPFVSVPSLPLHLHGFEQNIQQGGHIVKAQAKNVNVEIYPLDDLKLFIHNLAKASNPVKPVD